MQIYVAIHSHSRSQIGRPISHQLGSSQIILVTISIRLDAVTHKTHMKLSMLSLTFVVWIHPFYLFSSPHSQISISAQTFSLSGTNQFQFSWAFCFISPFFQKRGVPISIEQSSRPTHPDFFQTNRPVRLVENTVPSFFCALFRYLNANNITALRLVIMQPKTDFKGLQLPNYDSCKRQSSN